ncbi:MAG: MFS transporter [Acidimicrobiaceae bacterium]|nr:MFS transporter [Acidimicrobiaceae bacterium]
MRVIESLVPPDFRSALNGPLRRFFTCTFLACIGNGLTLSLFIVYLHNVRGFSIDYATILLAVSALCGLASSPLWGTMTDRYGPLKVAMVVYVTQAVSLVVWGVSRSKSEITVAALLLAVFGGAGWGPSSTMLSRLVKDEHRQRAFGFNFMLVNLGIGFGGLISATIVDLHRPSTFTVLYIFNAGVTVVAGIYFLSLRAYGGPINDHRDDPVKSAEGWREVLSDRRLVRYVVAAIVMMIGGYGSQEAGFSLFVVNNLHLPVHVIGIIFFFNTTTIVLAQLWVLNRIEGHSRTRVMAAVGGFWFLFWVILDVALALPAFLSVVSLCIGMVIFAIGETMLQPVGPAIVNQIAPEHLRGRYNAAAGLSWGISATIAPAITALYFNNHLGAWWPLGTGATALLGGTLMLGLRSHLSDAEDGLVPAIPLDESD